MYRVCVPIVGTSSKFTNNFDPWVEEGIASSSSRFKFQNWRCNAKVVGQSEYSFSFEKNYIDPPNHVNN